MRHELFGFLVRRPDFFGGFARRQQGFGIAGRMVGGKRQANAFGIRFGFLAFNSASEVGVAVVLEAEQVAGELREHGDDGA